jgi:UDP-glucose 4-epimerase
VKIFGDVTKANKILKWKTTKTLEEALRDAWRWECRLAERK